MENNSTKCYVTINHSLGLFMVSAGMTRVGAVTFNLLLAGSLVGFDQPDT